jgi:hypothetical protein
MLTGISLLINKYFIEEKEHKYNGNIQSRKERDESLKRTIIKHVCYRMGRD